MIAFLLLLGAVLAPLLASVALFTLRWRKARLGFQWLSASLGGMFSWLFLFGLWFFLPYDVPLASWKPQVFFQVSPALLADGFSWAVGFALASVGVAVVLTEGSTQGGDIAVGWAGSSLLLGLGLFAIFSGNQLTLLLAWAAIDLVELAIWLSRPAQPTLRERVILAFSSRAFAVMLSLWGLGNPWAYLVAILLRWGVFPFHLPYLESDDLRRGLGTVIRLVPPLTTMPLLARLADLAFFPNAGWMPILISLMAVFAFILWLNSKEALEGRPFWVIGGASFAFYAAIQQQPQAVLAWALVLALCGSFLFLIRERDRFWWVVFGYPTILLLGIPFTPFWDVVRVYRSPFSVAEILLFVAHWLANVGFFQFTILKPKAVLTGEPWSIALYRLAFLGLIGTSILIGYGGWGKILEAASTNLSAVSREGVEYFAGLGLLMSSLAVVFLSRFKFLPRFHLPARFVSLFSMEWAYRAFQWGFRQIGNWFNQIEAVLEGEGGILWAIVVFLILARFILFLAEGG